MNKIEEILNEVVDITDKYKVTKEDFDIISSKLWEVLLIRLSNIATEEKRTSISVQDIFNSLELLKTIYGAKIDEKKLPETTI